MTRFLLPLAASAVLVLSGCGDSAKPAAAPGGPGGAPPPPQVGVLAVQMESVGLVSELPGRLEPVRVAQVRARIAGIVEKRLFREGSDVKAGDVLFRLDAAPLRAALDSAQASLARSEATAEQNRLVVERYKPLVAVNAVSQQDYTNAQAAWKQAQADVAAGKAAVQTARINLGYATITAPISGRIGRALVTEGALVGQGEATQVATIQQINPVYVNFTQSVADMVRTRAAMESGKLRQVSGAQGAQVKVVLDDGTVFGQTGKLLFSDLTVDQTSGQVTLRAELPNPGGVLLPGMYVRVRIEQAQSDSAILLPQQAVNRTAQGDVVSVVGDKGVVSVRPIKLGNAMGNRWVVLDGLKAGEQVVVDGFQKMRPGQPVTPVPWQPAAAPAAAGAAAAPDKPAGAAPAAPAPAAAAPAAAAAK